jgi:hypothetical protein
MCGSCKNRRFGGAYRHIDIVFLRRVLRLLVTANVVPGSPFLATLIMEAQLSSETSVLTSATRRNIQEDGIPHSHLRETQRLHSINRLDSVAVTLCVSCEVRTGFLYPRIRRSS